MAHKIVNGEVVELTQAEIDAKLADEAATQAKLDSTAWIRNRRKAYPSIQDQLDMLYWDQVNGTTTWKDSIAAVKAANPKPE